MKFKILVNGHLTQRGADILGAIGVLILFAAAYFFEEWSGFWFWLFALVGGALGYVGAYGGLAKKFGFEAPFTNDPLGWRKAKKSYQNESEPHTEKNGDKTSP
jgi:4-hydroxybenzoate polyprenyltransferase